MLSPKRHSQFRVPETSKTAGLGSLHSGLLQSIKLSVAVADLRKFAETTLDIEVEIKIRRLHNKGIVEIFSRRWTGIEKFSFHHL